MGTYLDTYRPIAEQAVEMQGVGAMQKPAELALLLEFLAGQSVHNVLEIGSNYGGSTWAFSHVCTGRIICVDLQILDGRMEAMNGLDYTLVVADSTDLATVDKVAALMGDECFDFIFIDGDHSREAIACDFANWSPLCRPGGFVGFHDICHRFMKEGEWNIDMWGFWQEVSAGRARFEIYDPTEEWGGIGVVQMDERTVRWVDIPSSDFIHPGTLAMPAQCKAW